ALRVAGCRPHCPKALLSKALAVAKDNWIAKTAISKLHNFAHRSQGLDNRGRVVSIKESEPKIATLVCCCCLLEVQCPAFLHGSFPFCCSLPCTPNLSRRRKPHARR